MGKIILKILAMLALTSQCDKSHSRKILQVDRFIGKCPQYKNLSMAIENFKMTEENGILVTNSKIIIEKDILHGIRETATINRCQSREKLDTCELYRDITISNICTMLAVNLPPFNKILDYVHPNIRCPIKKGVYHVVNATQDLKMLTTFPTILGYYVKTHVYVLEKIDGTYKIIGCIYAEGKVMVN